MTWEIILTGISILSPVIVYLIGYFSMLNTKINTRITKTETKELIDLKLDPLKEDLEDIKKRIDKIIDYHLNRNV